MTDTPKINLTQLREAITKSRDDPASYPWYETGAPDTETTLALIDTAEAAQRTVASYLGGDPYCETDELGDLEETLNRFV